MYAFALEQPAFPIQSTGKTAQSLVGSQYPVAGYQHRDRIGSASGTDCANRFRAADRFSDLGVTGVPAAGYLRKRLPDLLLKAGAGRQIQRRQSTGRLSGERAGQCFDGQRVPEAHVRRDGRLICVGGLRFRVRRKIEGAKAGSRITRQEFTIRGGDGQSKAPRRILHGSL